VSALIAKEKALEMATYAKYSEPGLADAAMMSQSGMMWNVQYRSDPLLAAAAYCTVVADVTLLAMQPRDSGYLRACVAGLGQPVGDLRLGQHLRW